MKFKITHPEKLMFPKPKLTKGDILAYYEKIAPVLLRHLKDRPVTIERLPDGLSRPDAPRFWQKNTPPYYPRWIPRIELPNEAGKRVQSPLVNALRALLYFFHH